MPGGLFDELGPGDERHMTSRGLADEPSAATASLTLNMLRSGLAPRVARQTLAGWLDGLGAPPTFIDDVKLVVSELVTDAVIHANSPAHVRAEVDDGRLRLAVQDESGRRPATTDTTTTAGGYGLQFVAALTDDWGWSTTSTGRRVWIERRFADPTTSDDLEPS